MAQIELQDPTLRSSQWVSANIHRFTPSLDGDVVDPLTFKAIGELALLLSYVRAWTVDESLRRLQQSWHDYILEVLGTPAYPQLLRRYPARAGNILFPYLIYARPRGLLLAPYEDSIEFFKREGLLIPREVPPFRKLDQAHLLWRAGLLEREPQWRALYMETILASERTTIYLDVMDSYAVTHTLFYLTDFGNRPPPLTDDEAAGVRCKLECLLVHYWRVGHLDLVAELLFNLQCLDEDSQVHIRVSEAFLSLMTRYSAMPASRDVSLNWGSPSEVFRACYHTTLVSLLYLALRMRTETA